jgi:hypothetical protein
LVFGYQSNARHVGLADRLTAFAIGGIDNCRDATKCSFPSAGKLHTRQLAGCDFERESSPADCCFSLRSGAAVETLMEASGKPVLLREFRQGTSWYHRGALSAAHPFPAGNFSRLLLAKSE